MNFKKSNINDELLWNQFLSGDDEAYAYIYKCYVQNLFSFGLQFTLDRELLKDCIQDVFIKIYKNRRNLGRTDNIRLYLFVALKSNLINVMRKKQSVYQMMESLDPLSTEEQNIEDAYISREEENIKQEILSRMLNELSPRQRKVIHYRFQENLSISEISLLMEINPQSVQNLLQRAIAKMKKTTRS